MVAAYLIRKTDCVCGYLSIVLFTFRVDLGGEWFESPRMVHNRAAKRGTLGHWAAPSHDTRIAISLAAYVLLETVIVVVVD
jgi:hypothetical protein